WNVAAARLADGDYQIRAKTYCANGTEFTSDLSSGVIDLHAPVQFGTPMPSDGILSAGEDIRVRFNEDVFYNSAISSIEIRGETNQQEINHSTSVYFEGAENNIVIPNAKILNGDFSLEFWLKNATPANAASTMFLQQQTNGMRVTVSNDQMRWLIGGQTVTTGIADDGLFHHYTLTYLEESNQLRIYQDDRELTRQAVQGTLNFAGVSDLIIGGNTFRGNLHDLRIWSKSLELADAYAKIYSKLLGTERNLVGYWLMHEGHGTIVRDKAHYRHGQMNAAWDIKPKGTAYDFSNQHYLKLTNVGFVQMTDEMNATLEFWMKTSASQEAAIFSNGRGDSTDLVQSNGRRNKWSVELKTDGNLYFMNEGLEYRLSNAAVNDDQWHHVAIVLGRRASLRTYIDAELQTSHVSNMISGFSGNRIWIGARGHQTLGQETVDRIYSGKLDEVRLWNMERKIEQIDRDRYFEVDFNSTGLLLYAKMNEPDPVTANGPRYYHMYRNNLTSATNAELVDGAVSYSEDAPKIKPAREILSFNVNHVINGDEMILTPEISNWAILEGQVLDITVHRLFDESGNRQGSPVTWTAFVRRNPMSWYVNENEEVLQVEKRIGESHSFEITIQNMGGNDQPYTISNIPAWLEVEQVSGTLTPNSSTRVRCTINENMSIGEYETDLFLDTDYDYDEKISLEIRVLPLEPSWDFDPNDFEHTMNVVGKVRINNAFLDDPMSMVAAFVNDSIRGKAYLLYDDVYQEYFVYLTIYSNRTTGENVHFKIWNARNGQQIIASLNQQEQVPFVSNTVTGSNSAPGIFESTNRIEQVVHLNAGWNWVTVLVGDAVNGTLDRISEGVDFQAGDFVKGNPMTGDYSAIYDASLGWVGTFTAGIRPSEMYRFMVQQPVSVTFTGPVQEDLQPIDLVSGWNWLPFLRHENIPINEALAYLNASDNDVLKSRRGFAIYDSRLGWVGSITHLLKDQAYMLRTANAQRFNYTNFSNSQLRFAREASVIKELNLRSFNELNYSMSLIGSLHHSESFDLKQYNLQAISNGNVCGEVEMMRIGANEERYFLSLYSNQAIGDTIDFRLYNEQTGEVLVLDKAIPFRPDEVVGELNSPFIFGLIDASEEAEIMIENPVGDDLVMHFNMPLESKITMELHNLSGQKVWEDLIELPKGRHDINEELFIPNGVYIIHIKIENEKGRKLFYRKLLKR
ncbi:MAG: laminin G, partial [Cytophagales bacterium]|nr:laminin G [Cytophagales bacterium]